MTGNCTAVARWSRNFKTVQNLSQDLYVQFVIRLHLKQRSIYPQNGNIKSLDYG